MKTLLLLFLAFPAFAANWYVRPNGSTYGSANGQSWTNAWSGFSGIVWASVNGGDTIWVAGGTYTQTLSLTKSGTNNTTGRIFVRRARADASECTGASGWSAGYDSTVTHSNAAIYQSASNVVVSGRTTAAGGTYGWYNNCPSFTGEDYIIDIDANADNGTYEYIDAEGPGYVTYSGDSRGISAGRGGNDGFLFSHVKIHKSTSGIFINGLTNSTFEYIDESDLSAVNSASWHPNGLYAVSSTGITVRYSYFHTGTQGYGVGEGIFFEGSGGCSNWKIYGNVFKDQNTGYLKSIQLQASVSGLLVYNNTFINCTVSAVYTNPGTCGGTSAVRNNFLYNSGAPDTCGTVSNTVTANATSAFVDYAGGNFRPIATIGTNYSRDKGVDLGAGEYAPDPDGNTRGADGAWDVGAYEYSSAGTAPTITSTSPLPAGTVGTAYSQTLAATGDATITWSVTSGSLPAGLSLSSGGAITGTPTTAGTSTPTITATNSTGNDAKVLSITINAAPSGPTAGVAGKVTVNGKATIK